MYEGDRLLDFKKQYQKVYRWKLIKGEGASHDHSRDRPGEIKVEGRKRGKTERKGLKYR